MCEKCGLPCDTLTFVSGMEESFMMTAEQKAKLKRSVTKHEGRTNFVYPDTLGNLTIGIGYNLSQRGLDDEWVDSQYDKDVAYFYSKLCEFPWFHLLSEDRQIVLIDMAFMGWKHFVEFTKMFEALEKRDYTKAAQEMLESKWAQQVQSRASDLAYAMHTGVYNV
jgi:lysozyme